MAALVSVVIPTRNRVSFVRSAIDSVLAQDYQDLECVVVDGGSDDGTIDVLRSYEDQIKWVSEPDNGPAEAIERGWTLASGEILAWLNDDDLWMPGAVTAALAALSKYGSADVIYGSCLGINLQGEIIWWEKAKPWSLEDAILDADHIINQPTAFIARDALIRAGGPALPWSHDHDLWIRIALSGGTFCAIDSTLAAVRIHEGNYSMRPVFAHQQKIALIENWLREPATPGHIRSQRRRAISNAHLRGLHYLRLDQLSDWLLGLKFICLALVASPVNAVEAVLRVVKLSRLRWQRKRELERIKEEFGPIIHGILKSTRS